MQWNTSYVSETNIKFFMKLKFNLKIMGLALASVIASAATYLIAADHIDSPAVKGTRSDITDLYAFAKIKI